MILILELCVTINVKPLLKKNQKTNYIRFLNFNSTMSAHTPIYPILY